MAKACWRGEWDLTQKKQVSSKEPGHTHHDGYLKRTRRILSARPQQPSVWRAVQPPESGGRRVVRGLPETKG